VALAQAAVGGIEVAHIIGTAGAIAGVPIDLRRPEVADRPAAAPVRWIASGEAEERIWTVSPLGLQMGPARAGAQMDATGPQAIRAGFSKACLVSLDGCFR
jgi:hypothetical protein